MHPSIGPCYYLPWFFTRVTFVWHLWKFIYSFFDVLINRDFSPRTPIKDHIHPHLNVSLHLSWFRLFSTFHPQRGGHRWSGHHRGGSVRVKDVLQRQQRRQLQRGVRSLLGRPLRRQHNLRRGTHTRWEDVLEYDVTSNVRFLFLKWDLEIGFLNKPHLDSLFIFFIYAAAL